MRVLFSSTTGLGHVFPMVQLARAFGAAGHHVLWATGADVLEVVEASGIPAVAAGPAGSELERLRRGVLGPAAQVPPPERAAYVFPRMFGEALAPPMARDLVPLAREFTPDLLIHEHGELASPLVGAVLGVPSLTHAFGGAIPAAFLVEAGERLTSMWAEHGLDVPPYAGCFESVYLDICPASVQAVPMEHVTDIQPLCPAMVDGVQPDEPPLVYVTMGTVQNRALDLGPLVAAVARLPVQVLVAVGEDGETDLSDQPGNVRVEGWVDQTRVLERCSVVVSHGGSGTFLGALAQGVPQLCLPQAADQFRNAEGGVRTGAALALMPGETTPESVAAATSRLLEEASFRSASARVAGEIAAMPSPAEVVDLLVARLDRSVP